jgi:hypothetical protein
MHPMILAYQVAMCNRLQKRHRTLFLCGQEGVKPEYFGNCPSEARLGDEIVLIDGISLPAVLRRCVDMGNQRLIGFAIPTEIIEGHEGDIDAPPGR